MRIIIIPVPQVGNRGEMKLNSSPNVTGLTSNRVGTSNPGILAPDAIPFASLLSCLSVYIRKHFLKITKLIQDRAEFKIQFHLIPNASLCPPPTPAPPVFPQTSLILRITFIVGSRRSPSPSRLSWYLGNCRNGTLRGTGHSHMRDPGNHCQAPQGLLLATPGVPPMPAQFMVQCSQLHGEGSWVGSSTISWALSTSNRVSEECRMCLDMCHLRICVCTFLLPCFPFQP